MFITIDQCLVTLLSLSFCYSTDVNCMLNTNSDYCVVKSLNLLTYLKVKSEHFWSTHREIRLTLMYDIK